MSAEEEVLGKAYDARLMRRLLTYLRPYKVQTAIALTAIILKALADVLGPYLTKIAIDKYLVQPGTSAGFLDRFLSSAPLTGLAQVAALYVGTITFSFFLEFAQTYFMQWAGQKVMFDLRSQIFRHLQHMHIGFYDKNPVGRLVTRVTTDVDALNEMFTAGVVSIFEDLFVLAGIIAIMTRMNWRLALITFAVLPLIAYATQIFRIKVRDSYRRIRTAIARINSYLQEHVSGMVVLQLFNRERRAYDKFSGVNSAHMDAYKDDLDTILEQAYQNHICAIISVGIDEKSSRQAISLARKYNMVKATIGIHPHDVGHIHPQTLDILADLAEKNRNHVVGYGEIGLDYAKNYTPPDIQRRHFCSQLALAKDLGLPVIIHDRDAHDDTLRILRQAAPFPHGGIMHCFSVT